MSAAAGDERDACLVGFATQTSIHPRRFLVCLSERNRTYRIALHAEALGVHPLTAEQLDLARLLGGETADETDKLDRIGWRPGASGAPVLAGCPRWFVGRVLEKFPLGDHTGFLLEPIEAAGTSTGLAPLRLSQARDIEPGHPA